MKYAPYIGFLLLFVLGTGSQLSIDTIDYQGVSTKVELGKKLFFDPILSADKSISCASCHQPQFAFADNKAFSLGVNDSLGIINTPSVMNMLSRPFFFHDGRAGSLEEQAIIPVENPIEMNLPFSEALKRLNDDAIYVEQFAQVYQEVPTRENVTHALAEFQRSLESDGSAPHDMWQNEVNSTALSASQLRGREIFIADEFKCFECHFGPDFTGDEFRNIGLYNGVDFTDVGRYAVTRDSSDLGKFKVPGLRNVALTAPYMHNGMFETLAEVIDFYSDPGDFVDAPLNVDTLMIEPLNFSEQQKVDLVNFLHSLTDKNIPYQDEGLEH